MTSTPPPAASADTLTATAPDIWVSLTPLPLNLTSTLTHVRSPHAGAIVTFLGTTRDTFDDKAVKTLSYTSYAPLALNTLLAIAQEVKEKHQLRAVAITHRLGEVGVGEESIHIAVSAKHRTAAWRGGEEALEEVKKRVEIWKLEVFEDGSEWRANRDGQKGEPTS